MGIGLQKCDHGADLVRAVALIPALLLGSLAGKWLNQRLPNRVFIRIICIFVGLMGLRLLLA